MTKVYDLKNDKEVELDHIMDDEYLKITSDISENYFSKDKTYKDHIDSEEFKEGIFPSVENYSNFILKEDKIVFLFPKYTLFSGYLGITSVDIAYSDLKDYIKPNLLKEFTKVENTSKTHVDKDKEIVDIISSKERYRS